MELSGLKDEDSCEDVGMQSVVSKRVFCDLRRLGILLKHLFEEPIVMC